MTTKLNYINEIPSNSNYKYEVAPTDMSVSIKRVNASSSIFNYGYIKNVIGEDNDKLDSFIIDINEPIPPAVGLIVVPITAVRLIRDFGYKVENELKLLSVVNYNEFNPVIKDHTFAVECICRYLLRCRPELCDQSKAFHDHEGFECLLKTIN